MCVVAGKANKTTRIRMVKVLFVILVLLYFTPLQAVRSC
jgi:hypothetical protein